MITLSFLLLFFPVNYLHSSTVKNIYTSYEYIIYQGSIRYTHNSGDKINTIVTGENGIYKIILGIPLIFQKKSRNFATIQVFAKISGIKKIKYIIVFYDAVKVNMLKGFIKINKGCVKYQGRKYCISQMDFEHYIYDKTLTKCKLQHWSENKLRKEIIMQTCKIEISIFKNGRFREL